jgi:hypothetical protein
MAMAHAYGQEPQNGGNFSVLNQLSVSVLDRLR